MFRNLCFRNDRLHTERSAVRWRLDILFYRPEWSEVLLTERSAVRWRLDILFYRPEWSEVLLTHNSGRVTQICVFNTVKLGTSASSP